MQCDFEYVAHNLVEVNLHINTSVLEHIADDIEDTLCQLFSSELDEVSYTLDNSVLTIANSKLK